MRRGIGNSQVLDPCAARIDKQATKLVVTVNSVILAGIAADDRSRPLQGREIRRQRDIAFENDLGAGGGTRRRDRGIEVGFTKDIVGKGRRDDQKRRKRSPAEQRRAPMRKRRLR